MVADHQRRRRGSSLEGQLVADLPSASIRSARGFFHPARREGAGWTPGRSFISCRMFSPGDGQVGSERRRRRAQNRSRDPTSCPPGSALDRTVYVVIGSMAAARLIGARGHVDGVHGACLRYILRGLTASRAVVRGARAPGRSGGFAGVSAAPGRFSGSRTSRRVWGQCARVDRVSSESACAEGDSVRPVGIGWLIGHPAGRWLKLSRLACAMAFSRLRGLSGRLPRDSTRPASPACPAHSRCARGRFGFVEEGSCSSSSGTFRFGGLAESIREYREIGGSLRILSGPPFGSAMLIAIALGLIVFGLYQWVLAFYGRPE